MQSDTMTVLIPERSTLVSQAGSGSATHGHGRSRGFTSKGGGTSG